MRGLMSAFIWIFLLLSAFLPGRPVLAQAEVPTGLVLTLSGELTMPMLDYLNRGIRTAAQREADLILIQLSTPGGSVYIMNLITQSILASEIPVVVYVYPNGAMAGSAGTVITLAGDAAAMAPETAIGAASPIGSGGEDLNETAESKEKEILRATVRSLAERRPPEAIRLAEDTIERAKAVSAREALEIGLIDFIAGSPEDLMRQIDGFQVVTAAGETTIQSAGIVLEPLRNTLIEQLLQTLVNPNIVFLLLTIGVQAILIELSSPGGWVAGFIGVATLALATYGLGILPVNWFGIVFLVLAFVLFVLDIKAPTHGALTAAGAGSFIVGALVLFNSPWVPPVLRVNVPLVVGSGVIMAAVFLIIVSFGIRAQRTAVQTGQETVIGRFGTARTPLNPRGSVQVAGELWSAELAAGEAPLPDGSRVEVIGTDGLKLVVRSVPQRIPQEREAKSGV